MQPLSLQEQIGQILMVGFPGLTPTPEILELIRTYHIGNIVLFARNVQSPQQLLMLTTTLQQAARESGQPYPLLIGIDQENGMLRRFGDSATIFPGNMALGAIDDEELTREIAAATGRELKAMGVNMNLAPVVDVNNNPANPVIGVRSFSEDPEKVGRLAAATVEGYRQAGIATDLKHFPGHGDTATDSHEALPVVPYDLERLESLELIPFKRAIAAGADSIMIAHLAIPALMAQKSWPATVSPEIITELLRERLGYTGVIITDCLEMGAVADTLGIERGSVLAMQAGADIVLVSHTYTRQVGSVRAIEAALANGELRQEQIQQAAERVLALKARLFSWETLPDESTLKNIKSPAQDELRDRAYERSTTLVRDRDGLLPLRAEQKILLVQAAMGGHTMALDTLRTDTTLLSELRLRLPHVEAFTLPRSSDPAADAALQQAIAEADILLMLTVNASMDNEQEALMHHLLASGKPVIGLAAYNPYDLLAYPELGSYLVTYENTAPALRAAARVLCGEISAQGKLPVSIPGLYALAQ